MDLRQAPWKIYLDDTLPVDPMLDPTLDLTSDLSKELCRQYTEHQGRVTAFLAEIPVTKTKYRYAPEKWSVQEVVGHLTDANLVFLYRLLCIARGESKSLPGFDENAYVEKAEFDHIDWDTILKTHQGIGQATAGIIQGLTREAWRRPGSANEVNITPAEMLSVLIGHEKHHLKILKGRYGLA